MARNKAPLVLVGVTEAVDAVVGALVPIRLPLVRSVMTAAISLIECQDMAWTKLMSQ